MISHVTHSKYGALVADGRTLIGVTRRAAASTLAQLRRERHDYVPLLQIRGDIRVCCVDSAVVAPAANARVSVNTADSLDSRHGGQSSENEECSAELHCWCKMMVMIVSE